MKNLFNTLLILQGNAEGKFPWEQPGNGQGNPPPFEPAANINEYLIVLLLIGLFIGVEMLWKPESKTQKIRFRQIFVCALIVGFTLYGIFKNGIPSNY